MDRSDRCFGTPVSATTLLLRGHARSDLCFGTPASATTLLLCGQALSDQCFGTPASATTPYYVLYLRVLIVLCPTYFL